MTNFLRETGLVPVSANPPTFGHCALIKEALRLCRKVYVLIGCNRTKEGKYLFGDDEAAGLLLAMLGSSPDTARVTILKTTSTVADVALGVQADAIFRGVRDNLEAEREREDFAFYDHMVRGTSNKLLFVPSPDDLKGCSSSIVRGLVREHAPWVPEYVPADVWRRTRERIHGHKWVGVSNASDLPLLPPMGRTCSLPFEEALEIAASDSMPSGQVFRAIPDSKCLDRVPFLQRALRKMFRRRLRDLWPTGQPGFYFFVGWPDYVVPPVLYDVVLTRDHVQYPPMIAEPSGEIYPRAGRFLDEAKTLSLARWPG